MKLVLIFILLQLWFFSYAQVNMVKNVPDHSQPPTKTLPSTIDSNYCAPFAFLNIIDYWEHVQLHTDAQGLMATLPPPEAAEYIGWFMATNGTGSSSRMNIPTSPGPFPGTLNIDQAPGIVEYINFDIANTWSFPYPVPPQKVAYLSWIIEEHPINDFAMFETEINMGNPAKLDFLHWNIIPTGDTIYDPGPPIDTIQIYKWGPPIQFSAEIEDAPFEYWNLEYTEMSIGHAVTGVGYIMDTLIFAIVHDNWANTPKNIAIPWYFPVSNCYVTAIIFAHPSPVNIEHNSNNISNDLWISQNYPNPFNASTTIQFHLPKPMDVSLKIYNIIGEEIETIFSKRLPAGKNEYTWDASHLTSGIYLYRLEGNNFKMTKKMILLK
jgi:hypothetical protein